jgi:peptidoglycan/LPS O-acetylase OafA/YrhL
MGSMAGCCLASLFELQFYLLFPALLLFLSRYGARYYLKIICVLIALRAAVYFLTGTVHHLAFFSIFGALDIFLFGALAAAAYARIPPRQFPGWTIAVAFVLINAIIYVVHARASFFHFDFDHITTDGTSRSAIWILWPTAQGAMFAAFILVYLKSSFTPPFSAALAYLGKISYSLYAWHTIIFLGLVRAHWNFLAPFEMGLLVVLPLAVVISHFSYRLIEQPFLEMRVRYIKPGVATHAAQA